MLGMVLAFGMVLAGCDNGSTDDDPPAVPSIGIDATGFDDLPVTALDGTEPTFFSTLKSTKKTEALSGTNVSDKDYWYSADAGAVHRDAFEDAGGVEVTWNHSGDASGIWVDGNLDIRPEGSPYYDYGIFGLVRVDITLVSGTKNNAYLLYHESDRTFDGINTGFMGYYLGSKMTGATGINVAQGGLIFGATEAGTYVVKLDVNKVDPNTGVVVQTLATQTLTFVVSD
jgi:hypothetical protein